MTDIVKRYNTYFVINKFNGVTKMTTQSPFKLDCEADSFLNPARNLNPCYKLQHWYYLRENWFLKPVAVAGRIMELCVARSHKRLFSERFWGTNSLVFFCTETALLYAFNDLITFRLLGACATCSSSNLSESRNQNWFLPLLSDCFSLFSSPLC